MCTVGVSVSLRRKLSSRKRGKTCPAQPVNQGQSWVLNPCLPESSAPRGSLRHQDLLLPLGPANLSLSNPVITLQNGRGKGVFWVLQIGD